jgi:hypothetical protein
MVGLKKNRPTRPNTVTEGNNNQQLKQIDERHAYEKKQLLRIEQSLGLAAGVAALGGGFALHGFKTNRALPQWLHKEVKLPFAKAATTWKTLLSFEKGDIENVSGLQMFASFGTFAYMGQIASARGPIERFEAWTRYGWYGIANMILPSMLGKTVQPFLEKHVANPVHRQNYDFMIKMLTGAFLYAAPSAVLSLSTRETRFEKLQSKHPTTALVQASHPLSKSTQATDAQAIQTPTVIKQPAEAKQPRQATFSSSSSQRLQAPFTHPLAF